LTDLPWGSFFIIEARFWLISVARYPANARIKSDGKKKSEKVLAFWEKIARPARRKSLRANGLGSARFA